jgi:chromate reductase
MKIVGVCGSLQAESGNLRLLESARTMVPDGVDFELFDGIRALPHFNPDVEVAPESVRAWRSALASSDAVLIASPEYGHSLPGALKNAVDWVIGTGELESKIVAITASTPSADRGRKGLDALAGTLRAVNATILGGAPIARGPNADGELRALVEALLETVRRAG